MGFLEDLKNGDIKSIILVIFGILFFHLYWCKSSVQFAKSTKQSQCNEPMTNVSNDIKEAVKQVYLADVESIRNLSEVATKLQAGGLTIPGNLTVTGSFNYLPRGTIVAFNSTTAPNGWTLCDGSNGSPDLRGKFIRMWNDNTDGFNSDGYKLYSTSNASTYNSAWSGKSRDDIQGYILKHKFGSYAGSDLHHQHVNEMASHNHNVNGSTSTNGEHNHNSHIGWGSGRDKGRYHRGMQPLANNDEWITTKDGGNHHHTFNVNSGHNGLGWGASKQPPYYVLTWIMKL